MTLPYETIFSRTRGRINDPKELSLDENDLLEIYTERLHNILGKPRVRQLFSSIVMDDENQMVEFELKNPVDKLTDMDFVIDIFLTGMAIEWLQPQVDSVLYTSMMIGSNTEKKMLDPQKNMIERLDSLKKELNRTIRDYGYMYNSYINSET